MSNRAAEYKISTMTRVPLYSLNESKIEGNTRKKLNR